MALPPAATITIRETLAMLDGPKREIAQGVANDQYVFWLGSGISRERMPDLRDLAKRVLLTLHARVDRANADCRFKKALGKVVALAAPSEQEWAEIDFAQAPDQWPVFAALSGRLVNNYARMLNVTVDGEEADFLLWDVLDAANVYSDETIEPDAEHLCLAALMIEGVASEMPSANWDTLVERAVTMLAGTLPVLRVAVAPQDTRWNRRRGNLYKFHGCAKAARDDVAFRPLLVARQNQINGWVANNAVMAGFLVHLITTRATLMLGLSAQDSNIQGLFAAAEAQLAWRWPSHPPAYAFAENALGGDQESLLQNVYHLDHTPQNKPAMDDEALVQAYAKPLLLALYLHVVTAKLQALVGHAALQFLDADRDKLTAGLMHGRDLLADAISPSAEHVLKVLLLIGRTLALLRDGNLPAYRSGLYAPLTPDPIDRMPADPTLGGSGVCEFAVATGLIGIGLERGMWTVEKSQVGDPQSGSMTLVGRSGPARVYFAATPQAAIRLGLNGLIAANDDAVIVHSHDSPPPMQRAPRRPPGRTGLATIREASIAELLAEGREVEDLLERFRGKVAL